MPKIAPIIGPKVDAIKKWSKAVKTSLYPIK
jgi:hypothetical protein